jgi:hypothetical protein
VETYIHTLICADSQFAPKPSQVVDFIEWIVTEGGLDTTSSTAFQPGFRLIKPSGRMRTYKDPWTGEARETPASENLSFDFPLGITSVIEGLQNYGASASGEWKRGQEPFELFTPDGKPFGEAYYGRVGCELRASPVSTSSVDMGIPFEKEVPAFGEPCGSHPEFGLYSSPWNGERIEVHGAGWARFWIEFECGDFLLPKIDVTFEIMNRTVVRRAEHCFGTQFLQGWHYY